MKYIRTKNGKIFDKTAYKIEKLDDETFYLENDKTNFGVRVSDIVKEADTIEELCDEYVAISYDNWKFVFTANRMIYEEQTSFEFLKERHIRFCNNIVYGAIWTDKGLIYVAKMNEDGELCLI